MEYLLGASLSSFIAACVAVLILEPRVQSGERPSARTTHGGGAGTPPLSTIPTAHDRILSASCYRGDVCV
jgi:hypothetical protein